MKRREKGRVDIVSVLRAIGLPEKELKSFTERADERRVPVEAVIVMALTAYAEGSV